MTLDDFEGAKFKFSRNFALLRIFGIPVYQGLYAYTFVLARLSGFVIYLTVLLPSIINRRRH